MSIAEIVDRRRAARPTCLRRSRQRDAEQLRYFKTRTEDLQAKIAAYDMRANRRFYDIEPIAEENALLREQLAEARAEAAKYKGIAEPDASYFWNGGGYTLEHDLAKCRGCSSSLGGSTESSCRRTCSACRTRRSRAR